MIYFLESIQICDICGWLFFFWGGGKIPGVCFTLNTLGGSMLVQMFIDSKKLFNKSKVAKKASFETILDYVCLSLQ